MRKPHLAGLCEVSAAPPKDGETTKAQLFPQE